MADVLTVSLGDRPIGAITSLGGDRSVFTFDPAYVEDPAAPVLGAGFKNAAGRLITEHNTTQTRLLPFFSNLLPEGTLRDYLAKRAGVKPGREFFLLWALGADLPGAITVRTADGEPLPPGAEPRDEDGAAAGPEAALRFSLAGVQLKFSAMEQANKGLTIPAHGAGGDWIVKLTVAPAAFLPCLNRSGTAGRGILVRQNLLLRAMARTAFSLQAARAQTPAQRGSTSLIPTARLPRRHRPSPCAK